jgi:hypothetical protein
MPTQRTRTTGTTAGPQGPKEPQDPREQQVESVTPPSEFSEAPEEMLDLGIPDGMIDDDPGGYVPQAPVQELAGRKVRPMSPQDLSRAHQQINGERLPDESGMKTEQAPRQQRAEQAGMAAQAQRLLPEAFRQQEPSQPSRSPATPAQSQEEAQTLQETHQQVSRAASAFEYLVKVDREAKASGDPEKAAQTSALLGTIKSQVNIKERSSTPGRSPVLQRLVEHFGLEKIKPAEVEWGGFKWRFAPTNTRMDLWVGAKLAGNGYNAAALLIAAGVVGIDGEPIYRVMNIPLSKDYEISDLTKTVTKAITLPLYNKRCTCGREVDLTVDKCEACGCQIDPFELPIELRIESAERLYRFLEENFGVYEELAELVEQKDKLMKNRVINRDELYPFLPKKPSSVVEKTPE